MALKGVARRKSKGRTVHSASFSCDLLIGDRVHVCLPAMVFTAGCNNHYNETPLYGFDSVAFRATILAVKPGQVLVEADPYTRDGKELAITSVDWWPREKVGFLEIVITHDISITDLCAIMERQKRLEKE